MRRGLDTNVLVQAHVAAAADHAAIRRFLLNELADPDVDLFVTPLVLHELVHVITDARRFEPPVPMAEAVAVARLYLSHSNVSCAPVDGAAVTRALDLLERHQLGRKRIADALIAASLLNAGVAEILTCNVSDFAVFAPLRAVDPRQVR